MKEKIFEPFVTTKKTGTGLGLSIAYGIIERHKGKISVESQLGKGTTFKIILPIVKDERQA
ncbi:MAG: ATP-binding protein [Caldisericaceae bacterium]